MKKVFLMFLVSLCFGIITFVLWTGPAIAKPPGVTDLQTQIDDLQQEILNLRQCIVNNTFSDGRFVDNCDQTVTDRDTDLMWEKKDDNGGIHDKDNVYQWSSSGSAADGLCLQCFWTH